MENHCGTRLLSKDFGFSNTAQPSKWLLSWATRLNPASISDPNNHEQIKMILVLNHYVLESFYAAIKHISLRNNWERRKWLPPKDVWANQFQFSSNHISVIKSIFVSECLFVWSCMMPSRSLTHEPFLSNVKLLQLTKYVNFFPSSSFLHVPDRHLWSNKFIPIL